MVSKEMISSFLTGQNIIMILIFAFLLIVLIQLSMAVKLRRKHIKEGIIQEKSSSKKSFAAFMPLGFIFTVPFGIMIDNITLGIALGPALGILIGVIITSLNKKNAHFEKRELNSEELKLKKLGQVMLFLLAILGIALFLLNYWSRM